jgi:hypothetical protein
VALVTPVKAVAPKLGLAPAAAPRPPVAPRRSEVLLPLKRLGARLQNDWLPVAGWYLGRTGRPGLVGLGLLAASVVFLASTMSQVGEETVALRAELDKARRQVAVAPVATAASEAARALAHLPKRSEMPAILGVLLAQADAAHLTLDSGKYETSVAKSNDITSYKVAFPVVGPYPQVRQFIDGTLTALPAAAISELSLHRKSIADGNVEAQLRLTVYTRNGQ